MEQVSSTKRKVTARRARIITGIRYVSPEATCGLCMVDAASGQRIKTCDLLRVCPADNEYSSSGKKPSLFQPFIEADVRGMQAEPCLAERQLKKKSLESWLREKLKTLSRHSELVKAFAYTLN